MAKEPMLKNEEKAEKVEKPKREELSKAVQEEMQARANLCNQEIEAILKKHNCGLGAQPELVHINNGQFTIRAKPIIMPQ